MNPFNRFRLFHAYSSSGFWPFISAATMAICCMSGWAMAWSSSSLSGSCWP